ncbi:MAG TPA: response regulator [Planctomycetaceae bacterium]|nr:response regulator [Planctomycetaceae bacterium]
MTRILIVDDSAMDRRLAGGLLDKREGWSTLFAADGLDALEQLELHVPDLVLTDMQMPRMNGLELVSAVRKEYPLIPVILMTAQGSEEIAVQALQAGAASYVPKRRLSHDLVDVVERVLDAAGQDRSFSRLMNRLTRAEAAFVLENDLTLIPSVVGYLQQEVAAMRFCDETERLRIGVALEEALLNAYYHGNLEVSSKLREEDHNAYYDLARDRAERPPWGDRRIHVYARFSPDETVYQIRDEGPGFDPTSLPDPTDPANLERPCGRGLLLMQTFMDQVTFNDTGNQVTMVKRRPEHNRDAEPAEAEG